MIWRNSILQVTSCTSFESELSEKFAYPGRVRRMFNVHLYLVLQELFTVKRAVHRSKECAKCSFLLIELAIDCTTS